MQNLSIQIKSQSIQSKYQFTTFLWKTQLTTNFCVESKLTFRTLLCRCWRCWHYALFFKFFKNSCRKKFRERKYRNKIGKLGSHVDFESAHCEVGELETTRSLGQGCADTGYRMGHFEVINEEDEGKLEYDSTLISSVICPISKDQYR